MGVDAPEEFEGFHEGLGPFRLFGNVQIDITSFGRRLKALGSPWSPS